MNKDINYWQKQLMSGRINSKRYSIEVSKIVNGENKTEDPQSSTNNKEPQERIVRKNKAIQSSANYSGHSFDINRYLIDKF